jgi:hypothetical protein
VDSAWEQRKLEATLCEMFAAGAAESHTSGTRFVGQVLQDDFALELDKLSRFAAHIIMHILTSIGLHFF